MHAFENSSNHMERNIFNLALAACWATRGMANEVFAHYMASLAAFKAITVEILSLTAISLGQFLLNTLCKTFEMHRPWGE